MHFIRSPLMGLALLACTGCPDSGPRVVPQSEGAFEPDTDDEIAEDDEWEEDAFDEELQSVPSEPQESDEHLSQALPQSMRAKKKPFDWATAPLSGGVEDAERPEADLVEFLAHGAPEIRRQAAWALGYCAAIAKTQLSALVEQALLEGLDDPDVDVRSQFATALASGGPAASTALLEVARGDPSTRLRVSAYASLTVLQRGDQGDAAAVFAVALEGLEDPEPTVRESAVWLVRDLQHDLAASSKALLALLQREEQASVRTSLFLALGDCGPAAAAAVPALIAELEREGDVYRRRTAGIALGQIGGEAALKALQAHAEHPEAWVRLGALKGLIALDDPGHERAFMACMRELNAERGWLRGTEQALLEALSPDELRILPRGYSEALESWKANEAE